MNTKLGTPANKISRALDDIADAMDEMLAAQIPVKAIADLAGDLYNLRATYDDLPDQLCMPNERSYICNGCVFKTTAIEAMPYGERTVYREQFDCTVPRHEKCPAVRAAGYISDEEARLEVPAFLRRQAS